MKNTECPCCGYRHGHTQACYRKTCKQLRDDNARLEADNEQLRSEKQGTPRGRLAWISRYAEENLGHSRYAAKPPEVTVVEAIRDLQAAVARLEKMLELQAKDLIGVVANYEEPPRYIMCVDHKEWHTVDGAPRNFATPLEALEAAYEVWEKQNNSTALRARSE